MWPHTWKDWHRHHLDQARDQFRKGMRVSGFSSLAQAALCRRIIGGSSERWMVA